MSIHTASPASDAHARGLIVGRIMSFLMAVLMIDALIGYLAWMAVNSVV